MTKQASKLVAYGNWGIKDSYQDMPSETERVGDVKREDRERQTGPGSNDAQLSHTPTAKLEAGKSWQHRSGTCSHGNNNPEPSESSA